MTGRVCRESVNHMCETILAFWLGKIYGLKAKKSYYYLISICYNLKSGRVFLVAGQYEC